MVASNLNTQIRLFESLPHRIQSAIVAYANVAELSPAAVVEAALGLFLEPDSSTVEASPTAMAEGSILAELPLSTQAAIAHYANANQMPPEFVLELAIAHFLDPDAVTFDDCQLGVQREQIQRLKQYAAV
jgi:hypothetical protein